MVILWLPTFWSSKIVWPPPFFPSKNLWLHPIPKKKNDSPYKLTKKPNHCHKLETKLLLIADTMGLSTQDLGSGFDAGGYEMQIIRTHRPEFANYVRMVNSQIQFWNFIFFFFFFLRSVHHFMEIREVNKNNLLGGQFRIFLPKNLGK